LLGTASPHIHQVAGWCDPLGARRRGEPQLSACVRPRHQRNRGQLSFSRHFSDRRWFNRTASATPSTRTPRHGRCRTSPWRGCDCLVSNLPVLHQSSISGGRDDVRALFRSSLDSPLEGAGCEPSVPLAKELLFLERKCRKRRGSRRQIVGLPIVLGRSSACPAQIRLPSRFEATRRGLRTSGFRATDRAADNRNLIVGSSSKIAVAR
jgi:hypothetical protein